MVGTPTIERLLKRDREIAIAGLILICVLAWLYILTGAGVDMNVRDMATFTLFPYRHAMDMPGMAMPGSAEWGLVRWLLIVAMWGVMMIAMMSPSAAPAILLYARVHRHAISAGKDQNALAPTDAFLAGYILVWFGFSIGAAVLQWALENMALVSAMTMGSQSRGLSGAVLIAAGIYQLSPFKYACLSHCRAPGLFLARHWRPHALGALRLGAMHGAYCVGCCWMLMALLFVGGVMNLLWIAAIAILVLIEKLLPWGVWAGGGSGAVLISWGVAILLV